MAKAKLFGNAVFVWGLLAGAVLFFAADEFMDCRVDKADWNDDLLAIHGVQVTNPRDVEYCFYVLVPHQLQLFDRVQMLADKVSQFEFSGRPIVVVRIDDLEDKKIAIVDLHDDKSLEPHGIGAWYERFQGSTGGMVTDTTLKKSFLQKDYEGQWIDGVKFLYNGLEFSNDKWDHVWLEGTFMRDGTVHLLDGTIEKINI